MTVQSFLSNNYENASQFTFECCGVKPQHFYLSFIARFQDFEFKKDSHETGINGLFIGV